jgi:hypothetical protein
LHDDVKKYEIPIGTGGDEIQYQLHFIAITTKNIACRLPVDEGKIYIGRILLSLANRCGPPIFPENYQNWGHPHETKCAHVIPANLRIIYHS